ncbi:MAG: hypothetical protein KC656_05585, partial [Myxococcales bacterium]|nr:hypothetical protein [Myxococcales bacterium]
LDPDAPRLVPEDPRLVAVGGWLEALARGEPAARPAFALAPTDPEIELFALLDQLGERLSRPRPSG